jgi:hypothetical protein
MKKGGIMEQAPAQSPLFLSAPATYNASITVAPVAPSSLLWLQRLELYKLGLLHKRNKIWQD